MVVPLESYRRDEPFRSMPRCPSRDADVRSDERVGTCNGCGFDADWAVPIEALPVILATPARFTSVLADVGPGQWSRRDRDGGSPLQYLADVAEVYHATANRLRLVFEQARTEITPAHDERNFAGSAESLPIVRWPRPWRRPMVGGSRRGEREERRSARESAAATRREETLLRESPPRRRRPSRRLQQALCATHVSNVHANREPEREEIGESTRAQKPLRVLRRATTPHDATTGGETWKAGERPAVAQIRARQNFERDGESDAETFEKPLLMRQQAQWRTPPSASWPTAGNARQHCCA